MEYLGIFLLYVVYMLIVAAAPIILPAALAFTIVKWMERRLIGAFFWGLITCITILPIINDMGLPEYGDRRVVHWDFVIMPVHVVLWWYIWYRHWSRNTGSPWQFAAIITLIISAVLGLFENAELTIAAVVLLGIVTYIEYQRLERRALVELSVPQLRFVQPGQQYQPEYPVSRPRVSDEAQSRNINELGYRQFPGAVDVNITLASTPIGQSVKVDFRSSAPPEDILDFYEQSARACGLNPMRGTRLADAPDMPRVPALAALSNEPVAFVIARDTYDEFGWHITVWTKTWTGFNENLRAYFDFDEGVDIDEGIKIRKKAEEYEVFQQRVEEEEIHPRPVVSEASEILPMTEPVVPRGETADTGRPSTVSSFSTKGTGPQRVKPESSQIPERVIKPPRPPRKPFDWGEFAETYLPVWWMFAGTTMFVLATGYFLSEKYDLVGKVIGAYVFFAAFLWMGIHFERKPLFATFGKTLIAGGWGGFYITTFLIHHLAEAKVIHDPIIAALLLIMIAVGMIIHSFKYRSELLTTLTYVITFISIAMSAQLVEHLIFNLVASSILAVSMVIILYRMQWFRLAIVAMAGCYLTHAVWLYPINEAFEWTGITGANFTIGAIMLIFYWFIFSLAVYFYQPRNQNEEAFNLWMNALNYSMFYLVFQYQMGPENPARVWLVEALALAYVGMMFLSKHLKRENLYFHNLVIVVLSTTMALYYLLMGGNWVTVGWLFQAEALYFVGLLADDKRYRNVGIGVFMLIGVWMISHDYGLDDHVILFNTIDLMKRTIIAITVVGFFYINAALRHRMAFRIKSEEGYSYLFSYAASILWLIVMVRNWYPDQILHAAGSSAALAFILMEIGIRLKDPHFRVQGLFFAFLSIIAALFPMLSADSMYYNQGIWYRIIIEGMVVLLAYTVFARYQRKIADSDDETSNIEFAIGMISSVTAVLAVFLLHREFSLNAPLWLVLAWMVLGILLVEIGLMMRNAFFRAQGYVIAGLSMLWAVYSVLFKPMWFDLTSHNFIAQILVVFGFFYLFARLLSASRRSDPRFSNAEISETHTGTGPVLSTLFSVAGTLILILTIQRELGNSHPMFVSVMWMFAAVALLEAGIASMSKSLRWQAWTVAGFAFFYALFNNLVPGVYVGGFSARLLSLSLMVLGFYYIFSRVSAGEFGKKQWIDWPDGVNAFSWLAAILLVLLIHTELGAVAPAWVGAAWLIPMVAFLAVGLRRSSRNFIMQSIVLSTLVFFWTLTTPISGMFGSESSEIFNAQRIFATLPAIIVFYLGFAYIVGRGSGFGGEKLRVYVSHLSDVWAWWASVLLVSLLTREVGGAHAGITTVIWITLALIYHWVGRRIDNPTLVLQGYTLASASFLRVVFVNLSPTLVAGSIPSALIVAASLYYIWFTVQRSGRKNPTIFSTLQVASFMSYLASIIILITLYRVIDNHAWVPAAWGGFMLLVLATAIFIRDWRFGFKAVVISAVMGIGIVVMNFFGYGGVELLPASIAIGCIYIARILWQLGLERLLSEVPPDYSGVIYLRDSVKNALSIPASILLAVLLYLQFRGAETMYMTLGFALEAFLLIILGFTLKDRQLRIIALCLLTFSMLKIVREMFVMDVDGTMKGITLAGVAAVGVITGWLYSARLERRKKERADEQAE